MSGIQNINNKVIAFFKRIYTGIISSLRSKDGAVM